MDILQQLQEELTAEYRTSQKFLAQFPAGKNDYSPHEKSMKMIDLATHIVDIFGWPDLILKTD